MKRRIYTDTSVIGGCREDEFRHGSVALLDAFQTGAATIVISEVTQRELDAAPVEVRDLLRSVPSEHREDVPLADEAIELAEAYIKEGVVSRKHLADAQHIAIATVNRVDALVSWNFKHIVNSDRIYRYNDVNLVLGHGILEICTPTVEVLRHEENERS